MLTAHHQDDQAETVLLQLLRGAGPKGLAAMPALKPFAQGWLGRPLLSFTRAQLTKFAEQHALQWIEDESNTNTHFTRNFLRHDIMPLLRKRWPEVSNTLARVAENCAQAQQILDDVAEQDLQTLQGSSANTLSITKLRDKDVVSQRHILRAWLNQLNFPLPSAVKLKQIQQDMLYAREDKLPHFSWRGIELRRYRDDLYAMPKLPSNVAQQDRDWDLAQTLVLPNIGTLSTTLTQSMGLRCDITKVNVRFRKGGETLRLPGRSCHHELKKLFQDWGIPPWQRQRIPLVYVEDQLAAVVGYAVSEDFSAGKGDEGWLLRLETQTLS